jgi:hypothetical protein
VTLPKNGSNGGKPSWCAPALGKYDVHKVMLGGGFGRRGAPDYVRQAVLVAKQMPGTRSNCGGHAKKA